MLVRETYAPQETIQFFDIGESRDARLHSLCAKQVSNRISVARHRSCFVNLQFVVTEKAELFNALRPTIPGQLFASFKTIWKIFEQPIRFDVTCDSDEGHPFAATLLGLNRNYKVTPRRATPM